MNTRGDELLAVLISVGGPDDLQYLKAAVPSQVLTGRGGEAEGTQPIGLEQSLDGLAREVVDRFSAQIQSGFPGNSILSDVLNTNSSVANGFLGESVSRPSGLLGTLQHGPGNLLGPGGGPGVSWAIDKLLGLFSGDGVQAQAVGPSQNEYDFTRTAHIDEGWRGSSASPSALDRSFDGNPRQVPSRASGPERIEIRIEALDARSVLDRKEDIAEAVRQAMITSGVLGDPFGNY